MAIARDVDAGGGSAVDLRHLRQQRLVADLWIQRPRPCRRASGRAIGRGRSGGGGGGSAERCSAAPPARSGCSSRRSATRPGGCSASPSSPAGDARVTRLRRRDPRTGWLMVVGGACLSPRSSSATPRGSSTPTTCRSWPRSPQPLSARAPGLMLPRAFGATASSKTVAHYRAARDRRRRDHRARRVRRVGRIAGLGHAAGDRRRWRVRDRPGLRAAARVRGASLVAVAMAALLAAPASWAAETLGHATSGTFPSGGRRVPRSARSGRWSAGGGFGGGSARSGGGAGAGLPAAPGGGGFAAGVPARRAGGVRSPEPVRAAGARRQRIR